MTTLPDIIKTLEAADEGSRELDARIWCALEGVEYLRHEAIEFSAETGVAFEVGNVTATSWTRERHAEPVTTSIEAAVGLCERLLPDWEWGLGSSGKYAHLETDGGLTWQHAETPKKTPALALTIAVLKAHQEQSDA